MIPTKLIDNSRNSFWYNFNKNPKIADFLIIFQDVQKLNEQKNEKERLNGQKIQKIRVVVLMLFNNFTGEIESVLSSKNFMQLRNIVIILSRIIDLYPNTKSSASRILEAFKKRFEENPDHKNSLHYQVKSYKVALMNKKSSLPSIDLKSKLSKI